MRGGDYATGGEEEILMGTFFNAEPPLLDTCSSVSDIASALVTPGAEPKNFDPITDAQFRCWREHFLCHPRDLQESPPWT